MSPRPASRSPEQPRRLKLLLVRAGALGDIILLRRAVFALRRAGHRVTLLAPSDPGAAVVGPGPGEAHDLLAWESAEVARLIAGTAAAGTLARHRFDAAIAYTRDPDLQRAVAALAPKVIAHDPHPRGDEHASCWFARPAEGLADDTSEPPVCEPTADEREQADRWCRRLPDGFLAVHPGSGSAAKNWPADRFAAVLEAAGAADACLLIEGPADADVVIPLRARAAAIARSLPPRLLGAILGRSRAFVGNDSGVSHLAAAWGAPTVALFGPTDPNVWSPVGPRVRVVRSRDRTMAGITADEVIGALQQVQAMREQQ